MNKLYVVGIGPGEYEQMTVKALEVLERSDIIVGYSVYVDLIKDRFSDKEFFSTAMMGEVERCKMAVEKAVEGKTVSVVCSGDAGVYGMASLVYEVAEGKFDNIEIVSGVTAANSGAAMLGAPIGHDFSVISLSDLLTPYDLIMKRIECAAMCDMCIVIYNPSSKKRSGYLKESCEIMLKHKVKDTICAAVKNIGRDNSEYILMTLEELANYEADMFTTIFVGNSATKVLNGKMVTPRGYRL